jgi:hypothetical protein
MFVEGFESRVRNKINMLQYKCSLLGIFPSFLAGNFLVRTITVITSGCNSLEDQMLPMPARKNPSKFFEFCTIYTVTIHANIQKFNLI